MEKVENRFLGFTDSFPEMKADVSGAPGTLEM